VERQRRAMSKRIKPREGYINHEHLWSNQAYDLQGDPQRIHVREVMPKDEEDSLHKALKSRQKLLQDVSDMLVVTKAGSEKLLQTSMNLVRNIKKSLSGNCLVQWDDIYELAKAIDRYQERQD